MDEIIVNQIKYISSKRASAATGYAKDYVGQLVRQGKVDARKVGRSWYVNEVQILQHSGKSSPKEIANPSSSSIKRDQYVVSTKLKIPHPNQIESAIKKSWSDIRYYSDEGDILPISDKRDTIGDSRISIFKANTSKADSYPVSDQRIQNQKIATLPQISSQSKAVDGVQRFPAQDIVVLSRQAVSMTKYVDAGDFSRQWRYKSVLTTLIAAAMALLMPVIL